LIEVVVNHQSKGIPDRIPSKLRSRIAASTLFLLNGIVFSSWAARIPYFKENFKLNDGQLGTLLLCLPVGSLTILPLAGYLSTRFGSRITAYLGAVAYLFCLLGIAFAPNVYLLGISLVLMGASGNTLNIAENTQGIMVESLYGRPILSSFHGLFSLGGMLGAAFAGLMISRNIQPQSHFIYVILFCVAMVLPFAGYLIRNDAKASSNAPLFVWPDKALLSLGLIALCVMMGEGAMADWSSVYIRQYIPAKAAYAATGYTAFSLAMALGRFSGDWITRKAGPVKVVLVSGMLASLGVLLAISVLNIVFVIIGFALVGAGFSTVVPLVYSSAGRSKAMSASMALAAVTTVGFLGFLAGPPLIGFSAQLVTLRGSFLLLLVLAAFISFLSRSARR